MSYLAHHLDTVSADTVKLWLNDGDEIALLDIREAGQFGEGHPFFAVPAPYSRLELDVIHLVPRRNTRTVLIDAGDGVAQRAAARLHTLGYTEVHTLDGGAPGWQRAGHFLFKGVNLPSKTFGELVEQAYGTPHISAPALQARLDAGEPLVLLDGRTAEEHRKMAIPGAVSVPNGELALRWRVLAPDPLTTVVIHCAGRTRSIIGAQILRSLGIPNPVLALENGTQGWALAGLDLEHGSTRSGVDPEINTALAHATDRATAAQFASQAGVQLLDAAQAQAWLDDTTRTCFVLDVRSAAEFTAGTLPGARHAPGGQLLQATDQTIGVRGGRVLLLDNEAVRAPVAAAWLYRLGYETAIVERGVAAALHVTQNAAAAHAPSQQDEVLKAEAPELAGDALKNWVAQHDPLLFDLQPSLVYRQRHALNARWSVRPRLPADAQAAGSTDRPVLLLAPNAGVAQLAAIDLLASGWSDVRWTTTDAWSAVGLPTESTPDSPADAQAIDYLFFVHDRHDGNLDAARQYLEWETGLIAQCTPDELAVFRLPSPA